MVARSVLAIVAVFMCAICANGRRRRIEVRLEGGTQPHAGLVLVKYTGPGRWRGAWGGVCDNGWTKENAAVICRQLGYKGVVLTTKGQFYGRLRKFINGGETRIWLDRIGCTGREYHLAYCRHSRWGQVRCSRQRLAGVMCDPGSEKLIKTPPLSNSNHHVDIKKFKLTLWPKKNKTVEGIITEGVLVVRYKGNGTGVVCNDNWDLNESRVACGELGFTDSVPTTTRVSIDQLRRKYLRNLGFHLGQVACTGNEATLLSCGSSGLGLNQTCSSGQVVWLKCETRMPGFAHARLHGGIEQWEGRVEVRKRTTWATLCDKDVDIYTANVICRSLGYGTAKHYALGTTYAHAMEFMNIYETIKCTGKERYLQNCFWRVTRRNYPCKHYNDAGVKCNVPKKIRKNKMQVRLTGSGHYLMGKVEVNVNGRWGVICGDQWTMRNSMIVCKQLGLGYAAGNWSTAHYGRTGKILLSGVTCLGHETSLDECLRHDNVNCSQTKRFAALKCSKDSPDLTWDIKELASTLQIRKFAIVTLQCAYEEKCLSSSAESVFTNIQLRRDWLGYQRRLLRFSAKVHNVGTAAYRPYLPKNAWQWHSCHRHYHSDEEFAFYDLIDPHTHQKIAEGHKASYCLEDTKCDEGVDQFYFCRNGGDQGISVNCHDNYDYSLDCQWVDITDLSVTGRAYKLRLVANPQLRVGESDYSNNVVLCDVVDRKTRVGVGKCIQETCKSGVRSHYGNGNFACCTFPFIYNGISRDTCVQDDKTGLFWCATTKNYDQDKLFGYC